MKGKPLYLRSLRKYIKYLKPEETFPYAPTTGLPELRSLWRKHQADLNPGLEGKICSLPIVTNGLTHGLSIFADMFCDAGDILLLPDMMWGNYRLIFSTRRGADIRVYPFFDSEYRLDTRSFRDALFAYKGRNKILVLLNFPNNPTGYTPYPQEAAAIAEALVDVSEAGANVVACVDDAYTGLFYDEEVYSQSLFSLLADSHPRLTAIKVDGPTKEDYVWGFRLGFITEKKVGGLIRGTISKSSTPSQSLLIHAIKSPGYEEEKREKFHLLKERYEEMKKTLSSHEYAEAFRPYPFNAGYFMCIQLLHTDAERLRKHLLNAYGVGTIAIGERDMRIAFSCLEREQIKDLFDILYTAVKDLDIHDRKSGRK